MCLGGGFPCYLYFNSDVYLERGYIIQNKYNDRFLNTVILTSNPYMKQNMYSYYSEYYFQLEFYILYYSLDQ